MHLQLSLVRLGQFPERLAVPGPRPRDQVGSHRPHKRHLLPAPCRGSILELLLGRRSYEWFAARWPSRSGELAARLNSLPKYVVSSTLEHPGWNNSTVLKGDPVNEISRLKQQLSGDLLIPASFQLIRTLLEHDQVDELRLKIFPVVLGAGERLFGENSGTKLMRLLAAQALAAGITYLTYQPVRDAQ
ncbi:MAG TPA: dihydrofolate reductase family protein [Streptosporangiaceae bacterium]|nr:dihydrofolate reductase family protein [Streptosporangiaceae bacterium]